MAERTADSTAKREDQQVEEELENLNARTRRRGADRIRRKMEASIEAKSRRRRASEGPSSATWKR